MSASTRTWFISGCSSGFGRALAQAALERGDRVAVTARRPETVAALVAAHPDRALALRLDVTDPASVRAATSAALARFGRIDVLVNNAGYALQGAFEDASEAQIRRQFETNLFGLMDLTRALLPALRAQGSGHIVNLSSVVGRLSGPLLAFYSASKFAVEGLSVALAAELAGFGIKVTLVEPGAYATDFGPRSLDAVPPSAPYMAVTDEAMMRFASLEFGNPAEVVQAILQAVDAPAPPLRLLVGEVAVQSVRADLQTQRDELERWAPVSQAA